MSKEQLVEGTVCRRNSLSKDRGSRISLADTRGVSLHGRISPDMGDAMTKSGKKNRVTVEPPVSLLIQLMLITF